MEDKNKIFEAKDLFKIAICGALFLFLKDKSLKKNLQSFQEKSDSTFMKDILRRANSFEFFNAVLDKKKIFKSAVGMISECYDNDGFSETALFEVLRPSLDRMQADDKGKILEFIVLLAYDDKKITDKEKETLNQFRFHFGLGEKELNNYLKQQKPSSTKSYSKLILASTLPIIAGAIIYLNPFNLAYPDWLSNITANKRANTSPNSNINKNSSESANRNFNTEKITTCSFLLEDRFHPAKEFESGKDFAQCVNDWKIDSQTQDRADTLSENERTVPQENFELFKSFLRSHEKPKNLFNWALGVLTVEPDNKYLPYLAVFQHGCIAYLESITGGGNPLVDYFKGRNPDMYQQSSEICNKSGSLLSCGGLEEISNTNYLVIKEKFKKVDFSMSIKKFEGDMDDNEPYSLVSNGIMNSDNAPKFLQQWLYRKKELDRFTAKATFYWVIEDEWRGDKELCVMTYPHFPGNSIGFRMEIYKTDECDDSIIGFDFEKTYRARTGNSVEYDEMSKFIYHQIMNSYSKARPEPYVKKSSNSIHLLALVANSQNENRIFFSHVGTSVMQEGMVNILFPTKELTFMHPGGYMLYAYDIENRAFGLLRNLSQPIFNNGYVKSTAFFFPLD